MRWIAALTLLLAMAATSSAAESPEPPTAGLELNYSPDWPEPPDTSGMLLRLGVGTAVTIGLCVATMVFGRRWLTKLVPAGVARQLQIEESLALGHRASLYLVKIGETRLIAGTDGSGLKSLIVLPAPFQEVLDQQVADTSPVNDSIDAQPLPMFFKLNAQSAA